MKRLTDEELMTQVAKGNLDTLSILFDRYHIRIYNFFYKMLQNKMISEDLTQEVFVKILKHRTSYKEVNFTAWIYTIARNVFSTHYQKQKKEYSHTSQQDIKHIDKELESSNQEEIEQLHKALELLKIEDKELIIMHRFQEIQYSQIADIIGSSEGAVKVKVHRALKKLKDIYFQINN